MWHQMRVRLDLVFACSPQYSLLLPNAPQWRKQWLGGASLQKSHCAPGLCAPTLCCVHLYCAVFTHIVLCAPTLCCVHLYCAVCSHIVLCAPLLDSVHSYFKAHKANIVKPNILTILGLLAAVHSRLCALCTFHNAQYGSYIMQDCLLFLYMDADVEKPL